ncbi:YceI family protein [uncultured Lutibacter sp.]|uniref:YceI family protein n=1 Tax=uncultured Lutibacter sp. TaxID=437739 RepID=UPI0026240967|nr:YceI family protein [uncultured Lutibacter sp.]
MKKTGILLLVVTFVSMSFTNPIQKYNVDVENSTITWKGYKPTGSHEGTIKLQSGSLIKAGGVISEGVFTADMTSIKDADGSARLEGHLKSADFFEVETFPTATFKISNVTTNDTSNKAWITGEMTIKGITKEIKFPATISNSDETITITSETFQINRAEFNVKYKSKTFFNDLKDKFVNDEFDLQVTIVAKK